MRAKLLLAAAVAVLMATVPANAAVTYQYVAKLDTSNATEVSPGVYQVATAGTTITVHLFLQEVLTGGSTSLIGPQYAYPLVGGENLAAGLSSAVAGVTRTAGNSSIRQVFGNTLNPNNGGAIDNTGTPATTTVFGNQYLGFGGTSSVQRVDTTGTIVNNLNAAANGNRVGLLMTGINDGGLGVLNVQSTAINAGLTEAYLGRITIIVNDTSTYAFGGGATASTLTNAGSSGSRTAAVSQGNVFTANLDVASGTIGGAAFTGSTNVFNFAVQVVPEPSSMVLGGMMVVGGAFGAWRRRKNGESITVA